MTDTKIYTGYVAYYIRNLGQDLSTEQWEDILRSHGALLGKGTVKTWKEFALKLYYIHFIGLSLRLDTEGLIRSDKTVAELREILKELDEFRDTNDLGELDVVHYLTDKEAVEHMKNFYAPESVIDDVMSHSEKKAAKKTSKKPAAKKAVTTAKKTTTKKASPTTKATSTAKSSKAVTTKKVGAVTTTKKADVKIPTFLTVKQGRKTITLTKKEDIIKHLYGEKGMPEKKVSKPVKATKSSEKTCDSYSVADLRKMAQEKEVAGRSKMNKAELCKALKIKV